MDQNKDNTEKSQLESYWENKLKEETPKTLLKDSTKDSLEPFNSARLHPSMSYDEKTGSFYIDYSKL